MGGALIHGWAKSGELESITITAKHEATLAPFAQAYPYINTTTDNVTAVKGADVIVLAVKPWIMDTVIDEIRPVVDLTNQIVVSVAANYTTDMLATHLQCGVANLFYVMPNIAAEYGASMSFVARGSAASDEATMQVRALFEQCGDVEVVPESQVEAGMMMAGCGIAYVMRYIRAQMEAGVEMGFYPQQARQIALQTMQGAVTLLKETGMHPEVAIDKVTTPGGITIKGLNTMEECGFTNAVIQGLKASVK